MKTFRQFSFNLAAVLGLAVASIVPPAIAAADDDGSGPPPEVQLPRVATTETERLHELVGERVVVSGDVSLTKDWEGGINFINFADSEFTLVCFESRYSRFGEKRLAELYRGKRLEVVGIIELHKGAPQIRLESPSQVIKAEPLAPPEEEGKEDMKTKE